jgi:hypothetical protein
MGGTCNKNWADRESFLGYWQKSQRERDYWENEDVDGCCRESMRWC